MHSLLVETVPIAQFFQLCENKQQNVPQMDSPPRKLNDAGEKTCGQNAACPTGNALSLLMQGISVDGLSGRNLNGDEKLLVQLDAR